MRPVLEAACMCITGRVRRNNEDNFYFHGTCLHEIHDGLGEAVTQKSTLNSPFCAAVFDGVGGENFGEKASYTAAKQMESMLRAGFSMTRTSDADVLVQALNLAVVREKERLLTRHMGSTLAGIWIEKNTVRAYNLGDSRIYRFRHGVLQQISQDHTEDRPMGASEKPAITQYLGVSPEEMRLEAAVFTEEPQAGDRYLLCSDGLTDMVADGEISAVLQKNDGTEQAVRCLMQEALQHGGKDNITVILADIRPRRLRDSMGKGWKRWRD